MTLQILHPYRGVVDSTVVLRAAARTPAETFNGPFDGYNITRAMEIVTQDGQYEFTKDAWDRVRRLS